MSLQPKSYAEALARKQAQDARRRSTPRTALERAPLGGCRSSMKRSKMATRRPSKKATVDGDSEQKIKDENDDLVRKILKLRDSGCINEGCLTWQWSRLEVGHFVSRKVLALRWELANCWFQCSVHNKAHNEDPKPYRRALVIKVGLDRVRELEDIGRKNPELQYVDLLAIRDGLRAELKRWKH